MEYATYQVEMLAVFARMATAERQPNSVGEIVLLPWLLNSHLFRATSSIIGMKMLRDKFTYILNCQTEAHHVDCDDVLTCSARSTRTPMVIKNFTTE